MEPKSLSPKRQQFVEEFCVDCNGAAAARRAGYSERRAKETAFELLSIPEVVYAIQTRIGPIKSAIRKQEQQNKSDDAGYIYVIKCTGTHYYKIGRTVLLPSLRLSNLQVSLPFDLELTFKVYTKNHTEVERQLHERYLKNWIRGEWFTFGQLELKELLEILTGLVL